MVWEKQGLIFCPDGGVSWQKHSFMTPTPWMKDEETIRLYGGFRDEQGRSRIGYIDVMASDPKQVIRVSKNPVIDLGRSGTFDDRGMNLGDIAEEEYEGKQRLRLYYVGFQNVENAKFYAFSGCAYSDDGGETFTRYSEAPVMDRSDEGLYIRAIHSVHKINDLWHIWYSVGDGWETIKGVEYPRYHIMYAKSVDGLSFPTKGEVCILPNEREYRIGRPRVYIMPEAVAGNPEYLMYFTSDTYNKYYSPGAAVSKDGVNWQRGNSFLDGFTPSASGWDSEMVCYPVRVPTKYGLYLFYSGNNMGASGVGYCKWRDS